MKITSTSRNISVLLVEDNPLNQLITRVFLNKRGFHVTIANNGKEAVDLVQCTRFQIILMDVDMPEMDGCEATRQIRAMDDLYFKTVPILSFSTLIDNKKKAIEKGMTDMTIKPLNGSDLENKIVKYVTCE